MAFEAIMAATAIVGAGMSIYSATKKPPSPPKEQGAPATPVTGGEETGKKRKAYRPAAQLFDDKDLRLGQAGKLGL